MIELGADQRLVHCFCCRGFLAGTLIEKALPNCIVFRLVLFCQSDMQVPDCQRGAKFSFPFSTAVK